MIKVHLKKILKDRNMTISELSKLTGVSQKVLGTFINQKTESVHYPTIQKISSALNIEIGDFITNEDNIYFLDLELLDDICTDKINKYDFVCLLTDITEKQYKVNCSFEIINFDKENKFLHILILKMEGIYFPKEIRNLLFKRLQKPFSDYLYKYISYLLIQEMMNFHPFDSFDIYSNISVDFSKIIPKFICLEVSNDVLKHQNQTDIIVFNNVLFEIPLVPKNPDVKVNETNIDTELPFTPYIDSLIEMPYVYSIDVDPTTFKRRLSLFF